MTWHVAASVKIKLKAPATQRHRRERAVPARWRATSKLQLLFGLTSNIIYLIFVKPGVETTSYRRVLYQNVA